MRKLISVFCVIVVFGCKSADSHQPERWEVCRINHESPIFRQGTIIQFSPDSISLIQNNTTLSFGVILTEQRLLIKTSPEKLLFSIRHVSATEWILTELFTGKPIELSIIKIRN